MSEFINTIDLLGDEVVTDAIIQKTFEGEFADNVMTSLGDSAFRGCELITKINVPNVTGKLTGSFYGCTNLVKVNLPKVETIGGNVIDCSSIASICLPSCKSILDWGLRNLKLLEADLPVCTSIGKYAFYQADKMQSLILRSTEKCTFVDGSLAVYIDDKPLPNVKIFVPRALVDSYKADEFLTDFVDRIFAIEDYTVSGTTQGTLIFDDTTEIFDDAATSVGEARLKDYTALVSVDLPAVTLVRARAFQNCTSLKTVNLPQVTEIGTASFNGCALLEELDFPSLVKTGTEAFYGNKSLTKVTLPNLTLLGDRTFASCTELTFVDLPKCTHMGTGAFYMTGKVETLILRSETVSSLGHANAFEGNWDGNHTPIYKGTGYIYVPKALIEEYKVATNWSVYASQFRALEDYTVDGTVNGEFDESKI